MRIGIDGAPLFGNYSGVEYAIWNLLKTLGQLDAENEFVVYVPRDFRSDVAFPANWRFLRQRFFGRQKARRLLYQQLSLPRLMQRDRCDLFHAPACVMPLRAPLPVVLTVSDAHTFTHPQVRAPKGRWHDRRLMLPSLRQARRLIVPSQAVRADLTRTLGACDDKVRVIPFGVEEIFLAPPSETRLRAVKEEYGLPNEFILFVGIPEPKRNLAVLEKSLDRLALRKPYRSLPLVIVGDRRRTYAQRRAVRKTYSEGRIFIELGYVPRTDLPPLYALASVFVFPSWHEGFGLPPLEAMACGAPVIVSDRGALPEVVGSAGLLADPGDPDDIAAKLHAVTSDPTLRERLQQTGRERARQFTWERSARATLEVYREVMEFPPATHSRPPLALFAL